MISGKIIWERETEYITNSTRYKLYVNSFRFYCLDLVQRYMYICVQLTFPVKTNDKTNQAIPVTGRGDP
jgi:hypothetical protein